MSVKEVFNALKDLLPTRISDVFFIPHGVNVQKYKRPKNSNRKLRIAYLARHHVLKGLYDLPLINQLLLDNKIEVDWLIMGDGNERDNFIQETKHLENFAFAIPKTNEEVIQELKKCDLFILPSRKDGLPVALLESMSVGCVPVVSNFSEGIKKVVTEDIGYVVDVGNNLAFAECVTKLHRNREELKNKSKNAIDTITKDYNIKDRAKQYLELYKDYAKYRKVRKKRFIVRFLKNTYYFAVSKTSHPMIVSLKRKLFASLEEFRNK
jgi:glycosyltransferase involved in cell wall biosynthesis